MVNKMMVNGYDGRYDDEKKVSDMEMAEINTIDNNFIEDYNDRYTSNIGLYCFGLDYKCEFLSLYYKHICLKDEMLNSNHVSEENWYILIKHIINGI